MDKTAKLFRVLHRPISKRRLCAVSEPFRDRQTSRRPQGYQSLGRRPQESLTEQEKGEFAVRMFTKSWAAECFKQGAQAPLIVLKRGPRNEGRFEMYWESEPHLLTVALTALGGDTGGSLDARRATLKHRVEAGWGGFADVQCHIEPGRPARLVETFSSFAQMIAAVYAEAMVMHKSSLQRQAFRNTHHVNAALQPDTGVWRQAEHVVHFKQAQTSRR